jgi:two-component system, cell cycle response regulator DivK
VRPAVITPPHRLVMPAALKSGTSGADGGVSPGRHAAPRPLVLVAEDHDDTRHMLRYMLEARGCRVAVAADGELAVEQASGARFDLILMDVSLPRLDGLEAARRIRELTSAARVPIVFLSGHAEPAFLAAALEAGCDEYLTKPFEVERLDAVLAKYAGVTGR